MEGEYIDLYSLLRQVRTDIGEAFPLSVWISAEIASIQAKPASHCYLDLVQTEKGKQKAKAKAIIWASRYPMLAHYYRETTGGDMEVGQQLLFKVAAIFSELYGFSLIVEEVMPLQTEGDAERVRRQTIETLEKENLMGKQQELEMPALPYRLAVISARDAAGFGDFCRHLQNNPYGFVFDVRLVEAAMQGADAAASIAAALGLAAADADPFDSVLILRGGGSSLDLACFDDLDLCRAIARCPLPVFTAIGHDRDYHIADMVAYRFVKTPTALADEFIDMFAAEDERISLLENRLKLLLLGKVSLQESKVERMAERIAAADPRAVLKRGYTLALDSRGVVLKSVKDLLTGDRIKIMMSDGAVSAIIDRIER